MIQLIKELIIHVKMYHSLYIANHYKMPKHLGLLKSYAVIGATIADNFQVENPGIGDSLLDQIV